MVNAVHGAGESSDGTLKPGTYAVVLAVPDEPSLASTATMLEGHGVPVHRVLEAHGRYSGQLMALAVLPGPKSVRRRHLGHLPLVCMESFREYEAHVTWLEKHEEEWKQKYRNEIKKLKRELAAARKPWWKRIINEWRNGR